MLRSSFFNLSREKKKGEKRGASDRPCRAAALFKQVETTLGYRTRCWVIPGEPKVRYPMSVEEAIVILVSGLRKDGATCTYNAYGVKEEDEEFHIFTL